MNTYKAIHLTVQKFYSLTNNVIDDKQYIAINYSEPIKPLTKSYSFITHEYGYKCLAISYKHNRVNGKFTYTDCYRISNILLVVINLIFIIMAIITFYVLIIK